MVRRTYDGWGYSPLEQITPTNVARLQPVWVVSTGVTNGHEAPPIVNRGVMFVATPENQVIALDPKTGTVLWRYRRSMPEGVVLLHPTSRGVALSGDKVFFAAGDAVLVALDARTGNQVWASEVADNRQGYYMSLAPLIVDGKVMVGASGGELGVRGFVAAFDTTNGRQLWKTYTVPAPGEPGSETWPRGDQWKTGGGPVWVTGTYDPETRLAFWGTGNGGPWMGDQRPGDNLYTSSTVAIDVETGQIKGHFQYHPNDSWDWDEVSPPILVDYARGGRSIKGLINVARNGYLWFLERTAGPINYVEGTPYVKQNVFRSLDSKTGRPDVDPARQPGTGKQADFCPSHWGGKNWPPAAFSRKTRLLYIPANENLCSSIIGRPISYTPGRAFTGATISVSVAPGADHIGEGTGLACGHRSTRVDSHVRNLCELGADARNGGRLGVQRRHQRPSVPCVRRFEWSATVGVPDQLRRHRTALLLQHRWDTVHRRPVGMGNRCAWHAKSSQSSAGSNPGAGARGWGDLGVCAQVVYDCEPRRSEPAPGTGRCRVRPPRVGLFRRSGLIFFDSINVITFDACRSVVCDQRDVRRPFGGGHGQSPTGGHHSTGQEAPRHQGQPRSFDVVCGAQRLADRSARDR